MKKTRLFEIIHEEIADALTEIPDFGGRYDSQVADKHGKEDTLQSATDEIVDETLKDMGVTKADLKKDADKSKEVLKVIRKKIVGKNQDPRVKDALEKQEDFDDSGSLLQANQTNNAILKALGLKEPGKRGRKASDKKEPTTSKSEPKAKAREKDEEEKEAEASVGKDSTAKSLGSLKEKLAKVEKEMRELAKEFRTSEGDKKESVKNKLKKLTVDRKELEKELELI